MLLQLAHKVNQLHSAPSKQLLQSALWACKRNGVFDNSHGVHQAAQQHSSELPQQQQQEEQQQQQQPSSWREKLIALSSLTLCAQGHWQHFALTSYGRAASAATSLAAAATAAAAAPAGVSLAYFQIQNERPSHYWLRQFGLADRTVTHTIIAANVVTYGLQLISPAFTAFCIRSAPLVSDGEYWRLLTGAFVHANIVHVGINMFALYNIGHGIEGAMGSRAFAAVYLGSAVGGGLASQLLGSPAASALGASGGLFGVLGGYIALRFKRRHEQPFLAPDIYQCMAMLAINMAIMMAFNNTIDNWCHVGGLLSGALISAIVTPKHSPPVRAQSLTEMPKLINQRKFKRW